mmetsp:Transcript_10464/g.14462  ORF Transcript_10464/g.14462 Transcript_10464/m.14462 type:complete len:641 (+) Transcript_10464:80-2002(+)
MTSDQQEPLRVEMRTSEGGHPKICVEKTTDTTSPNQDIKLFKKFSMKESVLFAEGAEKYSSLEQVEEEEEEENYADVVTYMTVVPISSSKLNQDFEAMKQEILSVIAAERKARTELSKQVDELANELNIVKMERELDAERIGTLESNLLRCESQLHQKRSWHLVNVAPPVIQPVQTILPPVMLSPPRPIQISPPTSIPLPEVIQASDTLDQHHPSNTTPSRSTPDENKDDDNNDDDNDDNEHCWSGSDWLAGFAVRARLRVLDIPIIENDTDVGISGVAWNPNNDTKLAANFRGDDVFVFNVSPSAHKLSSPLRFRGRDNIATCAKEVRWLFGGTCLATGGDDGCLYIWRASDAAPLIKVRADRNVVNSLAPHPNLPLLVTSGIDSEIKLFEATAPAVSLSTHAGFNKSGISQDAANAPLSPIARQCSTVPLVTPEACPLFADRQAVDSDSSRSVCDSEDDSLDPGDWERRLSERPPSITAAHARSILSKATSLREHADSYARRGAHTAAARSYDAALALTRFSPPSLSTAAERASLRNSCDIAAARQHIIEHEYDAALRLLRKIQTRSEGLLPYLSPDFYRLYALVTPTLDATTTIPSETDSNHVEEIPALIQPLPTLEEVDHMITNCAEGPFASSAAC